jgi:mevalonate kinase
MPAYSASAPGKIILFGEHAVVYGRPAIAVPVLEVSAKAIVTADPRGTPGRVNIQAPDIKLETTLDNLPTDHPLAAVIINAASALRIDHIPACNIHVTSSIPVAAGMGSGAAVSVAILRAFSAFLGHALSDNQVCDLAYEVEKIHHGTPSGIDNTVITYAKPVYFVKAEPIDILQVNRPFTIVIGDTGIQSPTAIVVSDVRKGWEKAMDKYAELFDAAGRIAKSARQAIENGSTESLGRLMDANHDLLCQLGVSCPELDALVEIARSAGAEGAKLSGGGRGGNMIALVTPEQAGNVAMALEKAGAVRTFVTEVRVP